MPELQKPTQIQLFGQHMLQRSQHRLAKPESTRGHVLRHLRTTVSCRDVAKLSNNSALTQVGGHGQKALILRCECSNKKNDTHSTVTSTVWLRNHRLDPPSTDWLFISVQLHGDMHAVKMIISLQLCFLRKACLAQGGEDIIFVNQQLCSEEGSVVEWL